MQSHRNIMRPVEGIHPDRSDATPLAVAAELPKQSLHAATAIQTSSGVQRLDVLEVGQRVLTRAGTFEEVTQIDHVTLTRRQILDSPDAAPIRFDPGALPDMPEQIATLMSPDCPIAWPEGPDDIDNFPARTFCDGGLIRAVIPDEGISYIRIHFETAQQINAGGIWVELGPDDSTPKELPRYVPKQVHELRVFRPLRT